jgi:hypothetical protein
MMFGIILASGGSGGAISKTGHYVTYPIVGSALLTLGNGLLYLMTPDSGQKEFIPFFLIIGIGLGFVS